MQFALKQTRLGLRNSATRIPFRYGKACLTRCPQAILEATLETGGKRSRGWAGDCLPPGWFDKNPALSFRQQIDDMLLVAQRAQEIFAEEAAAPVVFFDAWLAAYRRMMDFAKQRSLQPLLASFGLSLVERAIIDALCRAANVSFFQAVRENLLRIRPGEVHPDLEGLAPADWLPATLRETIFVRHTVGLGDALRSEDVAPEERVSDGLPQAVEEYIVRGGVRYFKLKVSNRLEADLDRLTRFAQMAEEHLGEHYRVTLDGNEQYAGADEFAALLDALEASPELAVFWRNILVVEQPLERSVALSESAAADICDLSRRKPVIIDESDGDLFSYAEALELGYRGVSSKNCKGPIKSLLNAGLTWLGNDRGRRDELTMTGEDLCTVGVVPVQSDLALVAALGLEHVERNGGHYHPGLTYLPEPQRRAALAAHGDLYTQTHGIIGPHIRDGQYDISSLDCVGFGFAVEPDLDDYLPPSDWTFDSLGLPHA